MPKCRIVSVFGPFSAASQDDCAEAGTFKDLSLRSQRLYRCVQALKASLFLTYRARSAAENSRLEVCDDDAKVRASFVERTDKHVAFNLSYGVFELSCCDPKRHVEVAFWAAVRIWRNFSGWRQGIGRNRMSRTGTWRPGLLVEATGDVTLGHGIARTSRLDCIVTY